MKYRAVDPLRNRSKSNPTGSDKIIADFEREIESLAKRIVANSPFSHRANKRLLEATDGGLLDAGLTWEVEHSEGVGPDMHARIAAFTNRRK